MIGVRVSSGVQWLCPLLAFFLIFIPDFAWSQAQDAPGEEQALELTPILVTGSRIKRSELQGPQPMIIIDQQEMAERGYTTVYEALSDLTINNGFKFESPELSGGFSPDVQTINLRGFGVGTVSSPSTILMTFVSPAVVSPPGAVSVTSSRRRPCRCLSIRRYRCPR